MCGPLLGTKTCQCSQPQHTNHQFLGSVLWTVVANKDMARLPKLQQPNQQLIESDVWTVVGNKDKSRFQATTNTPITILVFNSNVWTVVVNIDMILRIFVFPKECKQFSINLKYTYTEDLQINFFHIIICISFWSLNVS